MKSATFIVAMCMLGYLAAPGHALADPMHLKGYMDKRVESLRYQGRRMLEDLPKHVSLSAHATKIKTKAACNDKLDPFCDDPWLKAPGICDGPDPLDPSCAYDYSVAAKNTRGLKFQASDHLTPPNSVEKWKDLKFDKKNQLKTAQRPPRVDSLKTLASPPKDDKECDCYSPEGGVWVGKDCVLLETPKDGPPKVGCP